MTSRRLTAGEVHAAGIATVENALSLMSDAVILLNAGRVPRAYALGVIAVEEVGKYMICRNILQDRTRVTVAELNKALRPKDAHFVRYAEVLGYLSAMSPSVPLPASFNDLESLAREDMKARERALYVEVSPSGAMMTPEGLNEDEARMWLGAMARYFNMLSGVWRSALDDALAAVTDSPAIT